MKYLYLVACFLYSFVILAQQDSIVQLKEVVLTDVSLQLFSNKVNKLELNDSIISTQNSLTSLLSNNSGIYFKENGKGMVASASFRGTTAQQTAVIWNGITINSQFNGQTDFNTLNLTDFSNITVRSGGSSVLYGTGAIGGSVHLNNDVAFKNSKENKLNLQYGSFETALLNYQFKKTSKRIITQFSITRNQSENDYEYLGYDKKNENGAYENVSFNSVFGYRFNLKNQLKLFSYFYNGERHFSGTISAPSKNLYEDLNTRNLLEWQNTSLKKLTLKTKVAYLTENYRFFENFENKNQRFSVASTFLARNNLLYSVSPTIKINSVLEYNSVKGKGESIDNAKRDIFSGSLLFSHAISERFSYEASIRAELSSQYKSPVLYSVLAKYKVLQFYAIRVNISKNFRIPTFNDLYWEASGNPDLAPETSFQYEISQDFEIKNFQMSVSGFRNNLYDMLRWLPQSNGLWQPENAGEVAIMGVESLLKWKGNFRKVNYHFQGVYSYTNSQNVETKKQLIYTPFHKFSGSLGISYKHLSLVYQYIYTGEVFTSSDNKNALPAYGLSNFYLKWNLPFKSKISVGVSAFNIENRAYQNVLSRPMPGRNYMFNCNLIL